MHDPKPPHEPELNDRQRKFVEGIARGLSAPEAAKSAGFAASYARKSSRLLKQPLIAKAVAEIRSEARSAASYSIVEAMREAGDAAAFAKQNKNGMALVRAIELRSRLSGLLIEEIHLKTENLDLKAALLEARGRVFGMVTVTPNPSKALTDARGTEPDTDSSGSAGSGPDGNGPPFGD